MGSLTKYGPATITILDETFDEIVDSPCLAVTRVEQIDLLDGSGSLVTESVGTFCRTGGSGDCTPSPGGQMSAPCLSRNTERQRRHRPADRDGPLQLALIFALHAQGETEQKVRDDARTSSRAGVS